MTEIKVVDFSEDDIKVLNSLNSNRLLEFIDFLRDYKEVLWTSKEYPTPMPLSKLRLKSVKCQPLPLYPDELIDMGEYFNKITIKNDLHINIKEEGFFSDNSLASFMIGTYFSPSLICTLIVDTYNRDKFFNGLFGDFVENSMYLKMLLHLEDCLTYYNYRKRVNND